MKKLNFSKMKNFLSCAFEIATNSKHWIMNEKYSKNHNDMVQSFMKQKTGYFRITYGKYVIEHVSNDGSVTGLWIGNYPYSFGSCYNTSVPNEPARKGEHRPSRMTIIELKKFVDQFDTSREFGFDEGYFWVFEASTHKFARVGNFDDVMPKTKNHLTRVK